MREAVSRDALLGASPTVSAMPLGEELSVFDAATGRALVLNRTAADVFALADGHLTSAQIRASLATAYGVEATAIANDVDAGIGQLVAAGVLRVVG